MNYILSNPQREEIKKADLVISLIPAHMHLSVAKECVQQKKHLVTASYITKEMQDLQGDCCFLYF